MFFYKTPLPPTINESLNISLQENKSDNFDSQDKYQLFSSINFDHLTIINENIDLNLSKQIFANCLTLLNLGMKLTDFPNFLIPRIVDLSSFYPKDQDLAYFSINFIYFLCLLDDGICSNFVDESVMQFLFNIIYSSLNLNNIKLSLYCLTNFTSRDKPKTRNKLNGLDILSNTHQFLNLFPKNYSFNDQLSYKDIISQSFTLVSNCLISYNFNSEIFESLIHQLIDYLYPLDQYEEGNEIEKETHRIWQISSIQTISIIIFWKSDYKKYFTSDEMIDLLIKFILSDFDYGHEELSIHSFCTIDNLSFKNDQFTFHFICHAPSFFSFQPPNQWKSNAKSHFCRLIITSIENVSKCRKFNKGGDYLELSMKVLRESAQFLIPLMMEYIKTQEYELREVATIVLCQFINLNDLTILPIVTLGHESIVEDFILLLEDNVSPNFAISLIKALKVLCEYGERLSLQMGKPNPFFESILNFDIIDVLDNCEEINSDSTELIRAIEYLRRDIDNYQRFRDIDLDQEDIVVLAI